MRTVGFYIPATVQPATPPPPPPSGVIPTFPISSTHPDWPTYLNSTLNAVAGNNSVGFGIPHVALIWAAVPDGWSAKYGTITVTKQMLRDWCVSKFRGLLSAALTKWNSPTPQNLTEFSGDSYLYCGNNIFQWVIVLNWFGSSLTAQEIADASMILEQAVWNVWNWSKANWNGQLYSWSGWGTNDPLNNYFYRSHWRGTLLWAIHSQSAAWLDKVRNYCIPLLKQKYALLVGGGSAEGTGYGSAYPSLFQNIWIWRQATGEDLSADVRVLDHLEYWVRVFTPDGKAFAPFGDQSRSSYPSMYDYYRAIAVWGILLCPDSVPAQHARAWLRQVGLASTRPENCISDCYDTSGTAIVSSGNSYLASGLGHLFAKSDDGAFVVLECGVNAESHCQLAQTQCQIYLNGLWRVATTNIFSKSGIMQATDWCNCINFLKSDGKTKIPQHRSIANTLTYSDDGVILTASADGSDSYSGSDVKSCKRSIVFDRANRKLTINDTFSIANGGMANSHWWLHDSPTVNADGSIASGSLTLRCLTAGTTFDIAEGSTLNADLPLNSCWRVRFLAGSGYAIEFSW